LFSEFAAALSGEFEITTVRYPAEQCLSYSDLAGFVRAACPISGPFVLLAESYSTPLAIKYAASNPDNLQGLVFCAGFAKSPIRGWRRFFVRSARLGPAFTVPPPTAPKLRFCGSAQPTPFSIATPMAQNAWMKLNSQICLTWINFQLVS
jgi:pimeloyl-ACP methyl ester carboxylesterase